MLVRRLSIRSVLTIAGISIGECSTAAVTISRGAGNRTRFWFSVGAAIAYYFFEELQSVSMFTNHRAQGRTNYGDQRQQPSTARAPSPNTARRSPARVTSLMAAIIAVASRVSTPVPPVVSELPPIIIKLSSIGHRMSTSIVVCLMSGITRAMIVVVTLSSKHGYC